jgi:hypothetical protein
MGIMGMDETQMILALRALRELLGDGDRDDAEELVASYRALGEAIVKNKPITLKTAGVIAEYLCEAGWQEHAIRAATAQAAPHVRRDRATPLPLDNQPGQPGR